MKIKKEKCGYLEAKQQRAVLTVFTAETGANKTIQTLFTHKLDKSPQDGIWLPAPTA